MKKVALLMYVVLFAIAGCIATGGPRPPKTSWTIDQRDVNAMAECQAQVPGVTAVWDPMTGYHLFEGEASEKYKECLKTEHGWFELEPPDWKKGTMAPPR